MWFGLHVTSIMQAMTQMDWEKERRRLTALYAAMEPAELDEIAEQGDSLTGVARQVLNSELSRRGMPALSKMNTSTPKYSDPPVMIRRYQLLPEALLSKSILDSAGIESFLADENLIRIDWFYSNLVGGIKLLVRREDAETANELLAQETPSKFDVDGVGEYQQPRCPKCQSMDVAFDELNKRVAYGGMLFAGLPIPVTSEHWKCHSCGNEWEDDGKLPGP
jgi:hypothetical protein